MDASHGAVAEPTNGAAASRLSGTAVLATALALGSLAGCAAFGALAFVIGPWAAAGIIAMPIVALSGFALGLLALKQIGRSGGAVRGRGFALVGVFVGLMSGVVQGSAVAAAVGTWRSVQTTLAPEASRLISAGGRGDFEKARAVMAADASGLAGDERMARFFAAIDARRGTARRASVDLDVFFRASAALRSAPLARDTTLQQDRVSPLPVEIECERGRVLCYVFLDAAALRAKAVKVVDLLAVLPPAEAGGPDAAVSGEFAALQPDGPAKRTGEALGWKSVE